MPDHIVRFLRRTLISDVVRVLALGSLALACLVGLGLPVTEGLVKALPGVPRVTWSETHTFFIFADPAGRLSLVPSTSGSTIRWSMACRISYTQYGQHLMLDRSGGVLVTQRIEEIPPPQKPPQDVIDAAISGSFTTVSGVTLEVRDGKLVEIERTIQQRSVFQLLWLQLPFYYWLLIAIVASLVLWAMRPRSPKCRRRLEKLRCPRCGYSMPNWVCSECGLGAAGEAQKG